jgi:DNA-binding NarL/FixJ family response regulator
MGGHTHGIVGRTTEVGQLRDALASARAGAPAVALITGEAGIGKTTLWRAALAGAGEPDGEAGDQDGPGPIVVTATGDEAERDLALGVVDQLLRQAAALGAAVPAAGPGPGIDPVRVGGALLAMVDGLGLDRPLAVVVDDAQWADDASLAALAFAARRLHGDPVLLCLACRDDGVGRLPAGLVRRAADAGHHVALGALDVAAVGELARRAYGRPVSPVLAARLAGHTGGHPLHTATLLDELPYEAAAAEDPAGLPAPRSYATLVIAQVAACGSEAREVVEALAVLGLRASRPDLAAMVGGSPDRGLDELSAHGLVELAETGTGVAVSFPHGLVRAGVLADLPPTRRAALHARAAEVTGGDESLRHRLAAASGPDAALVAAARARAGVQAAGGAPARAGRLLLAAAPLAPEPAERGDLVALAAAHLVTAGVPLGPLADEIARGPGGAARSYVLGRSSLSAGDPAGARRMLEEAWRQASAGASADAAVFAGAVADMLALLALHRREADETVTWARRSLATGSLSGVAATLLAHGLALDGRLHAAVQEMTALLDADPAPAPTLAVDARLGRGIIQVWANDLAGADADLAGVDAALAGGGTLLARVDVQSYRAESAYRAGRWDEALDLAEATASVVDDTGDGLLVALPRSVAAYVAAGRGRLDIARDHAAAAARCAAETGLMPAHLWATHASLRIAAAAGDHAAVAAAGDRLVADGLDAVPEGVHHWRATWAEALVAVGRVDDAAAAAGALAAEADRAGDVSLACEAARAAGVVAAATARRDEATERYAAGLELDPDGSRPLARLRLELAAGSHLRRSGHRRAAAALLAAAASRGEALGAEPWLARCEQEARACGLAPRSRATAFDSPLTAQERLVARLAAAGRTNREVAAELVISTKTVEHHLGRVYAKLGLRSRTELAVHLGPGGGEGG